MTISVLPYRDELVGASVSLVPGDNNANVVKELFR